MQSVPCNLCESNSNIPLFKTKDMRFFSDREFMLVKCTNCELVFLNPLPTSQERASHYPAVYFATEETRGQQESITKTDYEKDKMNKMRKSGILSETGTILDIGCSKGEFLFNMQKNGWEAFGVEISQTAADYAKKEMGIEVFNGELEEAHFPDQYFSVVTLWHVLEHLPDPSATLAEIGRILKQDGRLLVSVPNLRSLQAKIMKGDWYHLDVPRHIYHFAPKTITKLLTKTGFKVQSICFGSPAHNRDGVAFSLARKYERWQELNTTSVGDTEIPSATAAPSQSQPRASSLHRSNFLKLICRNAFEAFVSCSSKLERCLGHGGTMYIHAIKSRAAKETF